MKNACLNECMKEGLKNQGKLRFCLVCAVSTECAPLNWRMC